MSEGLFGRYLDPPRGEGLDHQQPERSASDDSCRFSCLEVAKVEGMEGNAEGLEEGTLFVGDVVRDRNQASLRPDNKLLEPTLG
jgi:hypothetical protein